MKWTKQQIIQYGTVQQSRKPFKCIEWELLYTDLKKSTSKAGKLLALKFYYMGKFNVLVGVFVLL
jgi:hypothetical protein